jgi:hypothetical protein
MEDFPVSAAGQQTYLVSIVRQKLVIDPRFCCGSTDVLGR